MNICKYCIAQIEVNSQGIPEIWYDSFNPISKTNGFVNDFKDSSIIWYETPEEAEKALKDSKLYINACIVPYCCDKIECLV